MRRTNLAPTHAPRESRTPVLRRAVARWLLAIVMIIVGAGALAACNGEEVNLPSGDPSIKVPSVSLPEVSIGGGNDNKTNDNKDTGNDNKNTGNDNTGGDTSSNSNSGDNQLPSWVLPLIGVVVLIAIVFGVIGWIRRRGYSSNVTDDIVTRGNWVLDQGVNALLGAHDPSSAQLAWSSLDGALTDISADVTKLEGRVQGDKAANVHEVRDAVAGLRMAAQTDAQARMSGTASGTPNAPNTSDQAVMSARQRLASALALLDPNAP